MGHMKIFGSALRHDFGSRVGLKFLSGLQLYDFWETSIFGCVLDNPFLLNNSFQTDILPPYF